MFWATNARPPRAKGVALCAGRRRAVAVMCAVAAGVPVVWPRSARADNYVWTNGDGTFNNEFNAAGSWNLPGAPDDTNDAALFDGSQPGSDTFTVTFSVPTLNDRLQINLPNPGGTITFNLNGLTYTLDGGGSFLPSILVGQGGSAPSGWVVTNGTVNAADITAGDLAGSSGGVQVLAGGTLNLTRFSRIGSSGSGALRVADGGDVTSTSGIMLASGAGSRGSLDVSGAGSTLRETNSLQVGQFGTASLQVFNGGLLEGADILFGSQNGGVGTGFFSGNNAVVRGKNVTVGLFGRGDVTVTSGARVEHTGRLEVGSQNTGSLVVTGAGSSWSAGTLGVFSLDVGASADGTLVVEQGGAVSAAGNFHIGTRAGATGTVVVAGAASRLTAGSLFVGGSFFGSGGDGTLTVAGGTVTVGSPGGTQPLQVYRTGTLTFDGGVINTQRLEVAGTFNWSGGTINVADDAFLQGGATGSGLLLGPGKALAVTDVATLEPGVVLTLDGGTFSTRTLGGAGTLVLRSGTFTLGTPITLGSSQLLGTALRVGPGLNVNTNANATVQAGSVLSLAGGSFSAATGITNSGEVQLADDFSALGGGTLTNNGLVAGSGRVNNNLTNAASGVVRASTGQRIAFRGAANSNAGSIDLVGGTVEFTGPLTNSGTGEIHGRGTLITGGTGLSNQGSVFLSSGIADVFGTVTNGAGGRIVVSGNADATFWDDVTNNGVQFKVAEGSSATFFGAFSGAGISGTGQVLFEGTVSPGSVAAPLAIGGDATLGADAVTMIGLAGDGHDGLDVAGTLTVAGSLQVLLLDGYAPSPGDRFDLFDSPSLRGRFGSISLPALVSGLSWDAGRLYADGSISVVPEPASAALVGVAAVACLRRRRRAGG